MNRIKQAFKDRLWLGVIIVGLFAGLIGGGIALGINNLVQHHVSKPQHLQKGRGQRTAQGHSTYRHLPPTSPARPMTHIHTHTTLPGAIWIHE